MEAATEPWSRKVLAGGGEDRIDSEEAEGEESAGPNCSQVCGEEGHRESDTLLLVGRYSTSSSINLDK